jgi:hypothetical protein
MEALDEMSVLGSCPKKGVGGGFGGIFRRASDETLVFIPIRHTNKNKLGSWTKMSEDGCYCEIRL